MQIPAEIRTEIAVNDKFFDLKGLAAYSSLGLSTIRSFIRDRGLPAYQIRTESGAVTKTLVKKSEFDAWMRQAFQQDLEVVVDEVMANLRGAR